MLNIHLHCLLTISLLTAFLFCCNAHFYPSTTTAENLHNIFKQSFGEHKLNLAFPGQESMLVVDLINRPIIPSIILSHHDLVQSTNISATSTGYPHKLSALFCFYFRFGTAAAQSLEVLNSLSG